MSEEHTHEEEPEVSEMYPIFMNVDGDPGYLIRHGAVNHFEDEDGNHVSVHVWRFR